MPNSNLLTAIATFLCCITRHNPLPDNQQPNETSDNTSPDNNISVGFYSIDDKNKYKPLNKKNKSVR